MINEFEVKPQMFNVNLFVEVQFVLLLYKGYVVFVQVAAGLYLTVRKLIPRTIQHGLLHVEIADLLCGPMLVFL